MTSQREKKSYTAALIGCGRIGYSLGLDKKREQPASHTKAILENKRLVLLSGCDTDPVALENWQKANPKSAAYNESANLYARQLPDIIVIAVNESSHLIETLAAMNVRPRLIILEKPVALNLQEAEKILDASEKYNVPVLVNHQRRFSADYLMAKNLMGKIGKLQNIRANLYTGHKVFSQREEASGSYSLLHDGTHLIDAVLFFLEDDFIASPLITLKKEIKTGGGLLQRAAQIKRQQEYYASSLLNQPVLTGIQKEENGDITNLEVHYANEKCPSVDFNFCGNAEYFEFGIELTGTEGKLCIGNGYLNYFGKTESSLYTGFYSLEKDMRIKAPSQTKYFSNVYANAVDYLDGNCELRSTIQNGMNAMAVIEEIISRLKTDS